MLLTFTGTGNMQTSKAEKDLGWLPGAREPELIRFLFAYEILLLTAGVVKGGSRIKQRVKVW